MNYRLTQHIQNTLYIINKKHITTPNYIQLYNSKIFKTTNYDDIFKQSESAFRFKSLLPTLMLSQSLIFPRLFLYTNLSFDINNQRLKIVSLRAGGYLTQQFSIDTIIPWSYRDMDNQSKLPLATLPTFIDDIMIYRNTVLKETLFCENDGQWIQQNINHPLLSLDKRANQKNWFDRNKLL